MYNRIRNLHLRSISVCFFLIFLFSLLIVHYYKIQVIDHEKWLKIANQQHYLVVKEPFHRGKIFCRAENDEKKSCMAMDVLSYHIFINPLAIKEEYKIEMIEFLSKHLDKKKVDDNFYKKSRWRKIGDYISLQKKIDIQKWWNGYAKDHKIDRNCLSFVKDYKRSYPNGHLLGQILSTVYKDRDETNGNAIPIAGIEKTFHKHLQGRVGTTYLMRSPKYTIDDLRMDELKKNGSDVYLTIHQQLQSICEEELMKGVIKVKGKSGVAMMADPYTGEIIAIAQYPFYSPERYFQYCSSKDEQDKVNPKAVTDCFEPGSIMKAITMAIGLHANEKLALKGESPIFCPYEMIDTKNTSFKGRSRPLKDIRDHKYLNMFLAIQRSSNIYPARIIERVLTNLGPKWYSSQLEEIFGFGKKTGIEVPYENTGMIPNYGKAYANGKKQWSSSTPYSLAIGYNILVNVAQMVKAYCVFANGGYLVDLTLLDKIVDREGDEIIYSKNKGKRVLSKNISDTVLRSLKYTTKSGGSACLADIPGYSEAGKTSTTEKIVDKMYSKDTHTSSFIGIAPTKNPKFVLMVVVDEPKKEYIEGFGTTHFGGKCAAPIFREIGKRSLSLLGVPYDDPYGFSSKDPRTVKDKADWYNETIYLNSIYDKWNK